MLLFLKEFRTDFKTILPEKLQSWFSNENPPEQVHNSAGTVIHVQQMASMHPASNQHDSINDVSKHGITSRTIATTHVEKLNFIVIIVNVQLQKIDIILFLCKVYFEHKYSINSFIIYLCENI